MRNNKVKLVVDTNVFVKSLITPKKYPKIKQCYDRIVSLIEEDKVELVFSQETIGELIYVMKNLVLHNVEENKQLSIIMSITGMFYLAYSVNTQSTKTVNCRNKYDNMFLKCAKQGHADYLISNDFRSGMHKIKRYKFKVLSSEKFLDIMNTENKQEVAIGEANNNENKLK